ncbi:hypothetical protein S7711_04210 [Stachybotrys chartarum IBT 7711]|uniref:Uncharacterized protein n=1 Tax=Stachybotrys chartarum (strain CBS 109288 / IBT 7711) TaxID=1280523 RepID=A0A084AIJ1_STACB|nr:hypothetical protein S7711_04210 [Stachybotrys chartarum IBT 7711]KFA53659.1 hypothetical protein S40293_03837 [Stachybotrys chartarum IBT 40293]
MAASEDPTGDIFQAIYIPKQKPPVPLPAIMKARLQVYPPLGQVTCVEQGHLSLVAVLELSHSTSKEPWDVSLWSSKDDKEWADIGLTPLADEATPVDLQATSNSRSRFYFSATLDFESSLRFTLRFRQRGSETWRWIRDEVGLDDGVVVYKPAQEVPKEIQSLVTDLNPEWRVSACESESPQTRLWSLDVAVPKASGDDSSITNVDVGVPWGSFIRQVVLYATCSMLAEWFSLVRLWSPWLAPRQGKSEFSLREDGVICSFLSPQGKHLVFLAISGMNDVCATFRSSKTNTLSVHARNDGASEGKCVVLVSVGDEFGHAVASVMYHARKLVRETAEASELWMTESKTLAQKIEPQWMENWYDGLGFCTWNALGQRLTDEKIFGALDNLAQNGIKISSLIIDDNWQSIDYRGQGQFEHGWVDFEAEPNAFPKGLKGTVSHIREKNPWIKHVAVWHALLGYWGGIAPDGKIAKTYETIQVDREDVKDDLPLGGKITVVAKEDVSRFYRDFYRFLSEAGVDSVKTDAQFMVDTISGASARRDLIKEYLDAWTVSALRSFGFKAISCMSQFPQALFHSQMPNTRPTLVVRNSDDFFPEIASSHPWHVWVNAHNAIFSDFLNVLPDWDMFQTIHDYSGFHAAARCVSGGPIYITDFPGQHNMDLINQMTGVTPRGNTVIFRPNTIGKSIQPYTDYHDPLLLKVGSYHGTSGAGTSILAVFNVSAQPLTELIPLTYFPGVIKDSQYVVRAHTTGRLSPPIRAGEAGSLLTISDDIRGYEIYWASPLTTLLSDEQNRDVSIANLGLVGKMTGCAAITSNRITRQDNGRVFVDARLRALGVWGLYISELPNLSIQDHFMVTIQGKPLPVETVEVSRDDEHVLEVDVERAWNEMELKSGWSNEVEVKLYFSAKW